VQAGQKPDWRIKESLIFSIAVLHDEIMSQKDLKA